MVALVISLVLLAGVFQIYLSSKQAFSAQESVARMQETGRFVTDTLISDMRRAGHWGGNADLDTISGNPGPNTWSNGVCPGDEGWARMLERRVFARRDNCPSAADTAASDILEVRFADGSSDDDNGLWIHSNLFEGRLTNSETPDMQPVSNEEIVVRPLRARSYFVAPTQTNPPSCPGAQSLTSLWRDGLEGREELARGVERLRVRFLEDAGTGYVDADAVNDWRSVQAVRAWVLIRAECPEPGLGNTIEYTLAGDTYQPNDDYRRHLFVNTVQLRNL